LYEKMTKSLFAAMDAVNITKPQQPVFQKPWIPQKKRDSWQEKTALGVGCTIAENAPVKKAMTKHIPFEHGDIVTASPSAIEDNALLSALADLSHECREASENRTKEHDGRTIGAGPLPKSALIAWWVNDGGRINAVGLYRPKGGSHDAKPS
jgi:hypothetical protein